MKKTLLTSVAATLVLMMGCTVSSEELGETESALTSQENHLGLRCLQPAQPGQAICVALDPTDTAARALGFTHKARGRKPRADGYCEEGADTTVYFRSAWCGGLPRCATDTADSQCRQETADDWARAQCVQSNDGAGPYFGLTGNLHDPVAGCTSRERGTWKWRYNPFDGASYNAAWSGCTNLGKPSCTPVSGFTPPPPPPPLPMTSIPTTTNSKVARGSACVRLARPDLYNAALRDGRDPTPEESVVNCSCVAKNIDALASWNDWDQCAIAPDLSKIAVWSGYCTSAGLLGGQTCNIASPSAATPTAPGATCPAGIFPIWTCTPDGHSRQRCVGGGMIETQYCGTTCVAMPVGVDDICN